MSWKPVPGYEGCYEISDLGEVKSLQRTVVRRRSGPRTYREKILAQDVNHAGYHRVTLHKDATKLRRGVHQLVLLAFVGPCPEGLEVLHRDGDTHNNRLSNLKYGTRKENQADVRRHGNNHYLNKTHCPKSHPYTEENTENTSQGRKCRECHRARSRASYAQRRAKLLSPNDFQASPSTEQ